MGNYSIVYHRCSKLHTENIFLFFLSLAPKFAAMKNKIQNMSKDRKLKENYAKAKSK